MNSSEDNSLKTQKGVFQDLKRRLRTTRKARINASKRLRKKHELYEKTTHVYSVVILVLSIWFIGDNGSDDYNLFVTKILLILSLALTFFTMYINTKNYKERASEFETNYQNLDILLNKIDRIESESIEIDNEMLKELHREYEKLLLEKENHQDIDYMISSDKLQEKFKIQICIYRLKTFLISLLVVIHPIVLLGFILLVNLLLRKFL
ncbi:SLATT domain-containing protein [Paenibacillus sp. TSA_86.1]|uniref:SLATT domain-containing protein n=1 Tax=Paenibacillus sp. TSA_86.1 TaxID=3415649 RepID=UPI004045E682